MIAVFVVPYVNTMVYDYGNQSSMELPSYTESSLYRGTIRVRFLCKYMINLWTFLIT